MMSRRIVVVEHDPLQGKVLQFLLADDGHDVTVTRTGGEALAILRQFPVDLVLLDTQLPNVDGLALIEQIRAARYQGPIVALGRRGGSTQLLGVRHEVDDYVIKPFDPLELLARVTAVLRRYAHYERQGRDTLVQVDDAELDLARLTYSGTDMETVSLTPTESRLLEHLMRHAGVVVTRDALSAAAWEHVPHGDANRIDVYIRRLRGKIETQPGRPQHLHTVRGVGYVFRPRSTDGRHSGQAATGTGSPDATQADSRA